MGAFQIMKLEVQISKKPSPCRLTFHADGSFGQGEPAFFLDYEINLSHNGSLEVFASKETGVCYCLEGFSWKLFSKARRERLSFGAVNDGQLHFALDEDDPAEWGGSFGREFELSAVDDERGLALYGEMPPSADVVRFACGQFVCLFKGEVVGFIIACPRFAFEVKDG